MADYYLLEDGSGHYQIEDGSGSLLLEIQSQSAPVDTGGGGVLLDLGKLGKRRRYPEGLSHIQVNSMGGERLLAGSRDRTEILSDIAERHRLSDEDHALMLILGEL